MRVCFQGIKLHKAHFRKERPGIFKNALSG
uniref:Uncharacterized protein n=2 Tax=unclassified Caudoviricetes TaxID=2788787 RepID=A0A8S5ULP5_9CAUD|nr:MAG TPA: hypothetical protein [Siphoviridae sp. ctEQg15]DAF95294.1 MAG TPA: hypothetical protein [Siphoviridae sp. ctOH142]